MLEDIALTKGNYIIMRSNCSEKQDSEMHVENLVTYLHSLEGTIQSY